MRLFIAATRQNDGKTIVSLGLISAFINSGKRVGYIKPVGQQFLMVGPHRIDKDAFLVEDTFRLGKPLQAMSPVAIPKGFTEQYIKNGKKYILANKIMRSFKTVSAKKDAVIIEGTGHAGVGSVFDMSNAEVAKLVGAKVIIVSCGGIGRPIDEIMLNMALFREKNVEVIGVIVNKVHAQKYHKISAVVKDGLARQGIRTFGVLPFEKMISNPSMRQLMEDLGAELVAGEENLENEVGRLIIGAMPPHEALSYFGKDVLIITPGNREDMIMAAISGSLSPDSGKHAISGIILTGKYKPHRSVRKLIERMTIPVLSIREDTFQAASHIEHLITKIRPGEYRKINGIEKLVNEHVDVKGIMECLAV